MTWQLFDSASFDARAARGFRLIGRLVLRRRQRLGLSQRQLEHLSGVDQTVISRLENGRLGGLRWSRFAELVDALGGLAESDSRPAWTTRSLPPPQSAKEPDH
jgi:transcriptional regulator with XRE-family HTH domain